jgi:hypothetical protein
MFGGSPGNVLQLQELVQDQLLFAAVGIVLFLDDAFDQEEDRPEGKNYRP